MLKNNKNLNRAGVEKNDEFYTQLSDVEDELRHYKKHFKNKVVLCNADDPRKSAFAHHLMYKFEEYGLRKLITTCYKSKQKNLFSKNDSNQAIWLEYNGDKNGNRIPDLKEIGIHNFKGDGDFRSSECVDLLKEADLVATNPPFSLFKEFVEYLMSYKKKFIIIGNQNAVGYNNIFKLLKENKIWLGNNAGAMTFRVSDRYNSSNMKYVEDKNGQKWKSLGNVCWFTNLDFPKRHDDIILYKKYTPNEYPTYDGHNGPDCKIINVNKTKEIPKNYNGVMGVPVSYLEKHNVNQFSIVGKMSTTKIDEFNYGYPYINGKKIYARILIKRKKRSKK